MDTACAGVIATAGLQGVGRLRILVAFPTWHAGRLRDINIAPLKSCCLVCHEGSHRGSGASCERGERRVMGLLERAWGTRMLKGREGRLTAGFLLCAAILYDEASANAIWYSDHVRHQTGAVSA